jgi:hypothetical protein
MTSLTVAPHLELRKSVLHAGTVNAINKAAKIALDNLRLPIQIEVVGLIGSDRIVI